MAKKSSHELVEALLDPAPRTKPDERDGLERVLEKIDPPDTSSERRDARSTIEPVPTADSMPALRTARVLFARDRVAEVAWRGGRPMPAIVAEEVEPALIEHAAKAKEAVLVEVCEGKPPVIVGIVQTRIAREATLRGTTVTIEAEQEILLRSGRGALRIREDGEIELVGSRIVAASRGLFRIVGRMLRLN
jgi:hypothetical protein